MMHFYPFLEEAIFKRGIKKLAIAKRLGVSQKTLSNKLSGKTELSWPEACAIQREFFPDIDKDFLFANEQDAV